MQRKPIVVVGSVNMDLVALSERIPSIGQTVIGSEFQVHPGGKGANQAVAVARLGYPVTMIGRIGSDAFGQQLKAHMQAAGVDCSGLQENDGASGVAVILVSSSGDNCIVVTPGANGKVSPEDIDRNLPVLQGAGLVLVQLEIPYETVDYLAAVCKREGVPLMLDPAPATRLSEELMRSVAWFTPNETEAAFYLDEENLSPDAAAPLLLAEGCRGVVLKMGSRGAYVVCNGVQQLVTAFPVKAVDSTAAGDAFNGAFAVSLMLGNDPASSTTFASAAAAISVTRSGAQPSMPTMREVEEFLRYRMASDSASLR